MDIVNITLGILWGLIIGMSVGSIYVCVTINKKYKRSLITIRRLCDTLISEIEIDGHLDKSKRANIVNDIKSLDGINTVEINATDEIVDVSESVYLSITVTRIFSFKKKDTFTYKGFSKYLKPTGISQ